MSAPSAAATASRCDDVELQAARLAPERAHLGGHLLGGVAPRVAVDHDVVAVARQAQRDGAADAAARAR